MGEGSSRPRAVAAVAVAAGLLAGPVATPPAPAAAKAPAAVRATVTARELVAVAVPVAVAALVAAPVAAPVAVPVAVRVPAGASAPTVVPVLTTVPFGALPGQRVTHTITLSGTGTGVVPGVRLTFTSTVALDGVAATVHPGRCPVITATVVSCDVGNVRLPAAAGGPTVTVTGTLRPGTPAGALVQARVGAVPAGATAPPPAGVVSNAYLMPAVNASPAAATGGAAPRAAARGTAPAPSRALPVCLAVLFCLAVLGTAVLGRRLRRPTEPGGRVTSGAGPPNRGIGSPEPPGAGGRL